jgi:hypothetical protein
LERRGAISGGSCVASELDSTAFPDDTEALRTLLAERDAAIATRDAALAERDAALAERDADLLSARLEIEKLKVGSPHDLRKIVRYEPFQSRLPLGAILKEGFERGIPRTDRGRRLHAQTEVALVGIRGDGGISHDQGCDEGAEEGFAAAPGVVHELEEAEIQRQLLL